MLNVIIRLHRKPGNQWENKYSCYVAIYYYTEMNDHI